jgi:uncharacterized protein (TIGR03086 family)
MSELADRFRRRADTFETLVAATPPDRWSSPSPCGEWDARGVVEHVVVMLGVVLRPLGRDSSPAPSVADDPLGAFRAGRSDVQAIFDDPELAERIVTSPAGVQPAAEMIDAVVSQDMVFHGWDLAMATGQDATIDPAEVAAALPVAESMPPEMYEPGAFGPDVVVYGPRVDVGPDANAQDQLLGLLGRDPAWQATR